MSALGILGRKSKKVWTN